MSRIRVERITDKQGTGAPLFPNGIRVVGLTSLSNVVANTVSIGGTLTYEDVTNVDSIGVVTARSGLDITAGGANIVGVVTASTGINAASNLILKTGGNEKVRIDSSGNVLVGTTDTTLWSNTSGAGINLRGGQVIDIARSGDLQLTLNRMTNEGANIGLYQAGGIKGTIGTKSDRIYFGSADGAERLSIASAGQLGIGGANYGTSGQVLTSGGASAAPSWADVSAGIWTTIASGTVTSGSTGTMTTNGISSTYHLYKIHFYGTMNGSGQLGIDITTNGGSSWSSSGTDWTFAYSGREHNSNWTSDYSGKPAGFLLEANRDNWWGEITFGDTQNSSTHPSFNFVGGFQNNSTIWGGTVTTNMNYAVNTAFNGIRWYSASAAMSNVKWVLQGTTFS